MKIRYRWYGDADKGPMIGCYLMSLRGRGAYLVLGVDNRGRRGGLGEEVYFLLSLTVERVPRAEAEAAPRERFYALYWDKRLKRSWRLAT
jgi:hypothetical protein